MSVSDSTGSITLFGLGDPGPFNVGANYPEQHFSTDYTEFFVDAEGVAVDVGTQLPVHEAPVGVLCSAALIPYENQPCKPRYYPEPLPRDELMAAQERLRPA